MTRRNWLKILIGAAVAVAVIVWMALPAAVPAETVTVRRGVLSVLVEEDGITRVRDRYVVAAPVAGMLMRPTLRVGDAVKRGEVVAVIAPNAAQMLDARTRAELRARVEAAAAHAARARSVVRQAEAALFQAESDHKRLEELGTQGYASASERERSAVALELRRKDVEAARFEAEAAEYDLAQARAAVREGDALRDGTSSHNTWTVPSPIDGTVLRVVQESEGAVAMGAPILEIGDLARLEACIDVLSIEATRIQEHAYVELDAGGVKLSGRVRRIEPSGFTRISALGIEEQRVNVLVDLLPNPTALQRVADGYRVDAAIEIEREENALLIPLSALFRHGESWATWRVVDGRAQLATLKVGSRGNEVAAVLGGLAEGDEVIAYPSDAIRAGVRVKPRETGHP